MLHHATLKAAVLVYAALIGTMTEESLKAEIAKNEKGFSPQEIDEIYAAVVKSKGELNTEAENQPATSVVDTPKWVAELLASNLATQQSNQAVVDAISQFKELAGDLVSEVVTATKALGENNSVEVTGKQEMKLQLPEFDEDAIYEVIVPFRDSSDFTKLYKLGEDVSHLGEDRIKHLLLIGNVEEA